MDQIESLRKTSRWQGLVFCRESLRNKVDPEIIKRDLMEYLADEVVASSMSYLEWLVRANSTPDTLRDARGKTPVDPKEQRDNHFRMQLSYLMVIRNRIASPLQYHSIISTLKDEWFDTIERAFYKNRNQLPKVSSTLSYEAFCSMYSSDLWIEKYYRESLAELLSVAEGLFCASYAVIRKTSELTDEALES